MNHPDADDPAGSGAGHWDSVSGVLLYPRRPTNATRLQLIEDLTSREAIMVVWYDETDWAGSNDDAGPTPS